MCGGVQVGVPAGSGLTFERMNDSRALKAQAWGRQRWCRAGSPDRPWWARQSLKSLAEESPRQREGPLSSRLHHPPQRVSGPGQRGGSEVEPSPLERPHP